METLAKLPFSCLFAGIEGRYNVVMEMTMRKTISILIVLVVASLVVLADVAPTGATSLIIEAEVGANNIIKVTDQPYVFTSYQDLASLDDVVTSSTVINEANYKAKEIAVGHLNYFTNQSAGLRTSVQATKLTNRSSASTGTSHITYYVMLDGIVATTAGDDVSSPVDLLGSSSKVYRDGSKAITVWVDPDSFSNAHRGSNYSAIIIFSYEVY